MGFMIRRQTRAVAACGARLIAQPWSHLLCYLWTVLAQGSERDGTGSPVCGDRLWA